jgi:V/A-type H+-transporting ATPase subunit D
MASRMPESRREITPTRIALLELKHEKQLVHEGYEPLDEKRILLATEIQRQLAQLVALRRECADLASDLRSRTVAAVGRHGMDELSVYPPLTLAADRLQMRRSRRFGLVRAVELAACCVNLRRLVRDYVRTERRARAIENVLMPEIESAPKIIDEQLEGMDQEEIARLRQRRGDLT